MTAASRALSLSFSLSLICSPVGAFFLGPLGLPSLAAQPTSGLVPSSSSSSCPRQLQQGRYSRGVKTTTTMQFGGLGSLLRGSGGPPPSNDDPNVPIKDVAPSWSELASSLSSKQTEEERTFRERLASGKSSTNALANLRLFDAPEGTEPTVTLYRDYAAWCPYCEKVWLQLEEKRIPYRVEKVNMRCYGSKPDWFMRMQPSGGIPVAKVNGVVITESNDILQALEDDFPQHSPLIPEASNPHAPRVRDLLRLEREIFGSWFRWLCSNTRSNDSQQKNFEALMDRVDGQLREANDIAVANGAKEGRLFLGDSFSIVDCMFAPFLERMAASVPYYKGLLVRGNPKWPHVTKWFEAMEERESFQGIMSDYYTHVHDLPPQIGQCYSVQEAAKYADEIDGKGDAWRLPLTEGIEKVHIKDDEAARREAAERIVSNHDAIVKFCLRAVGQPGMPRVSSPLADPNAIPNEKFTAQVDCAMRHVVDALLHGGGSTKVSLSEGLPSDTVKQCLAYMRERTSVPRDMSWSARRQLMAHLNLVIDSV